MKDLLPSHKDNDVCEVPQTLRVVVSKINVVQSMQLNWYLWPGADIAFLLVMSVKRYK